MSMNTREISTTASSSMGSVTTCCLIFIFGEIWLTIKVLKKICLPWSMSISSFIMSCSPYTSTYLIHEWLMLYVNTFICWTKWHIPPLVIRNFSVFIWLFCLCVSMTIWHLQFNIWVCCHSINSSNFRLAEMWYLRSLVC